MRLRKTRGVRKRYVEEPIISDDENSNDPVAVRGGEEPSGEDDGFEARPSRDKGRRRKNNHGDDDDYDDNDGDYGGGGAVPFSDDDDDDDDDDDQDDTSDANPSSPATKRTTTTTVSTTAPNTAGAAAAAAAASPFPTRRQRSLPAGTSILQSRGHSFHSIPPYPLETRIVTRVYAGPLRRYARYSALRDTMFGPEHERIRVIWQVEVRFSGFPVLPPRWGPEDENGVVRSPWVGEGFERVQARRAGLWYDDFCGPGGRGGSQRGRVLGREEGEGWMPREDKEVAVLLGRWDRQKEYRLRQGGCLVTAQDGLPVEDPDGAGEERTPSEWVMDVGGIPLAVAWAPLVRQDVQVLAVATVPFADQAPKPPPGAAGRKHDAAAAAAAAAAYAEGKDASQKIGCIQLWEFVPQERQGQLPSPSTRPPRLLVAQFFDWGRPKRVEFCPAPMDPCGLYGMMAILCGDGKARIIEAKAIQGAEAPRYEWIESPVATLGLTEDYNVGVTCLAWVNINRVALGHSDGSVTLWSIHPRQLLQRVGVHTTYVIDICSGYPSHPYLVASVPVGGCVTLTDLSQPSSEMTYFPVPSISFQPNLLSWSEPMQGFMALYPSSTPNTTVAFLHHRYFCQARSIATGPNALTCVSAGATHPYTLVGCADGTVFSCNALQKLFKQKGEPMCKLRVFEHEHRPIEPEAAREGSGSRGAVRILQGFLPEENDDPRTEKRKEMNLKKKAAKRKKKAAAARKKGGGEDDLSDFDREAELDEKLASRVVIHEPLTRVTTARWNPNLQFSCWAACAMASGIIKVMDLGVVD
ncbi:hypothetical protein VTJ83DRAFT_4685 [Remersonia thermophila]|uniref:Transcription factor tau subunit sfc6 n=1 Tax=Remersonia thermophila TaxID=72144 RepID=A0ABR4DAQ0_9PEZI